MSVELPYEESSGWSRWGRLVALALAIGVHAVFAATAWFNPEPPQKKDTWVEMAVVETPKPPPPPPPPPPEPEPEKPKPKPKVEKVAFKETVTKPPPEPPPPAAPPPRRVVQGLSGNSFAQGPGPGISVRAGTTLATKAEGASLKPEEATQSVVRFAAVTTQPRCDVPRPDVPPEVIEQEPTGKAKILFDVSESGAVTNVRLVEKLIPAADEACLAAVRKARCKPGKQDDQPVVVTDYPWYCSFRAIN